MGLLIKQQRSQKIICIKESWACENAKQLKEVTDFMHQHSIEYAIQYPTHETMTDNTPTPINNKKDYMQINIDEQVFFDEWEQLEPVFNIMLGFKKKYGELPWHTH